MKLNFIVLLCLSLQTFAADRLDLFRSPLNQVVSITLENPKLAGLEDHWYNQRDGVIVTAHFANQTRHELKFKYYQADKIGPRPLVVVVPPIIGSTPIDQLVSDTLGQNEIDVIIPEFEPIFKTAQSLEEMNDSVTNYLIAVRLLIKNVINDPTKQIQSNRVGIYGMSLGAVVASILVGVSEDINYAYILNGGGNLSEISQNSNQSKVVNFKKHVIESGHATAENWLEATKKIFNFEPLDYAKYAQGKKIFMVMCEKDEVIPYKNQMELWNALGKPPFLTSTFHSHVGTIIKWVIKSRYDLIDFMKQ